MGEIKFSHPPHINNEHFLIIFLQIEFHGAMEKSQRLQKHIAERETKKL